MTRPLALALAVVIMMGLSGAQNAFSQECDSAAIIYMGSPAVEPCSLQQHRISIPIYINNPCPIGGFQLQLYCTDPDWLAFDTSDHASADTIGSRISNWESFGYTVSAGSGSRINVVGIANMPGGREPYLEPGNGLFFTIHPRLKSYFVCDSSQEIIYGTVMLSDTTGYQNPPRVLESGEVIILPGPCDGHPRGDANCNGILNGMDVVYLVNFLKGRGSSFCCLCSGDANHNGAFNGLDVTFLINYLKGFGAEPDPCD